MKNQVKLVLFMAEIGRPRIIDDIVLKKLEEAFALGCTDEEASFYADISPRTLYNYQTENPEFLQRKDQLKQNPILKARQTLVNNLDKAENARWFLERKKKEEFGSHQEVEHTGEFNLKIDGESIYIHTARGTTSGDEGEEAVQSDPVRPPVGEDDGGNDAVNT